MLILILISYNQTHYLEPDDTAEKLAMDSQNQLKHLIEVEGVSIFIFH